MAANPIESHFHMLHTHQEPTDQRPESGDNGSKTRSLQSTNWRLSEIIIWYMHTISQGIGRSWSVKYNSHEAMWQQCNKTVIIDY